MRYDFIPSSLSLDTSCTYIMHMHNNCRWGGTQRVKAAGQRENSIEREGGKRGRDKIRLVENSK